VVRDNTKKVREELTEEEILKWGTSGFMDHLQKKQIRALGFTQHKDPLFISASNS
jgi:hypothetical protein